MDYSIISSGSLWTDGVFCVPNAVTQKYIKMASEYQIKALLIILSSNGKASSKELGKSLGLPAEDIDDILEFWVDEGVLSCQNDTSTKSIEKEKVEPKIEKEQAEIQKVDSSFTDPPKLNPSDIVRISNEREDIKVLLIESQNVRGSSLSQREMESLINAVTFYGMPVEVVLMILRYSKSLKDKGQAIGMGYVLTVVKKWIEKGITDLPSAEIQIKYLEDSDKLWERIVSLSGIKYHKPSERERTMINEWDNYCSIDMIALACDYMKENADTPSLKYVNTIIKNWIKDGVNNIADAKKAHDEFTNKSQGKNTKVKKLETKPTFDIDEIENRMKNATVIDI